MVDKKKRAGCPKLIRMFTDRISFGTCGEVGTGSDDAINLPYQNATTKGAKCQE